MNSVLLIYGLIYLGSALMVYNIIRYVLFIRQVKQVSEEKSFAIIYAPLVLLILFLAGYLAVGFFGKPDLIISGILFGGSVFVFLMLILVRKITDRIREQEQLKAQLKTAEEASYAKTMFLSNMSHDIRTPLNAILGYACLAQKKDLGIEELKDYLHKIEGSGEHLLALINDVLEMSRIESGKSELEQAGFDLRVVMSETRDMFSLLMQEKQLTYTVVEEDLKDPFVIGDKNRIDRILLNLVSNAYKFTPEGGSVKVTLRQTGKTDGKGCYQFLVQDTGIGMTEEFAQKVFEAFEREKTSTVSGIQGTGLGMAICKRFVDMMNGTISVETAPGMGTTFCVELELSVCTKEKNPETGQPECAQDAAVLSLQGLTLLLAEDMRVNREIADIMLSNMGMKVAMAENGKEAVEMVAASAPGEYAAVLMDVQMPVMDGYEATRQIRQLADPALAKIPVIAVTANAFAEDRKKALDAGMDGHIAKPIDPKAIENTLREVLKNQFE